MYRVKTKQMGEEKYFRENVGYARGTLSEGELMSKGALMRMKIEQII